MEQTNLLVTIVVPIYNVEQYLPECLDSIQNQTVIAHKAILVDDGSLDKSGEIAQTYAKKYPEMFRYIHQKNCGQGAARNKGLQYVDTPFVMFLDSDDWLLARTIENVKRAIEKEQEAPDAIFMNPIVYDMASKNYLEWSDTEKVEQIFRDTWMVSPKERPDMYALEASVCRNIWRTALLKENAFSFPEGLKWEDVLAHFDLYHWMKRCIKIDCAGFYYRINSGKQTTSSAGVNRLDIINIFSKVFVRAVENNWTEIEWAYALHSLQVFAAWSISVAKPQVRKLLVKELHDLYRIIPKNIFLTYRSRLCPSLKDKMYWYILRTPIVYKILGDRIRTRKMKKIVLRLKKF